MNMAIELEEDEKSLADYVKMFKRRKKQMLVPAAVVFLIALLVAFIWPPTYRSSATILIEQQQIPKDLVASTVTSYAAQQIEVIKARIMTMKNIMELVNKYELYSESDLRTTATSEIVAEFADDVSIDVLSAEVIDPKTGRPTEATIAFTLSYQHSSPDKSMKATNELVNLFLNENLRDRTEKSATTSLFLKEEVGTLARELERQEEALAQFKTENEGSLPELYQYNLQIMDRTQREILDISLRLKELEKRKLDLQSQLVQLSPYAPTVMPDGQQVLSDYDRLKSLKSQYRQKVAVYSEDHPDVKRIKREIDVLEKVLGVALSPKEYAEQLRTEENVLSELKQKYTADHPKVLAQERVVEQLKANPPAETDQSTVAVAESADNPAYVLLETQLRSTQVEVQVLKDNKAELEQKIKRYEDLILKAPMVEKQYISMQRDYENAALKYKEMKAKQLAAELGRSLEQERKGERFTLIDPAILPEEPVSPNRPLILLLGLVAAAGLGVGTAIILEALTPSIRGRSELAAIAGMQPLVVIPYIETSEEGQKQKSTKLRIFLIAGVGIIVALVLFHFLVKPLDVTWYVLLRKLGLS